MPFPFPRSNLTSFRCVCYMQIKCARRSTSYHQTHEASYIGVLFHPISAFSPHLTRGLVAGMALTSCSHAPSPHPTPHQRDVIQPIGLDAAYLSALNGATYTTSSLLSTPVFNPMQKSQKFLETSSLKLTFPASTSHRLLAHPLHP